MDQGRKLTAQGRRHCRYIIGKLSERGLEPDEIAQRIREYWWGFPAMIAYSLAYLGAVSTCEPLDLPRVRDSRS